MTNFDECLAAWSEVVGSEAVISEPKLVAAMTHATYDTNSSVTAIIYPSSVVEVKKCVDIANKYKVPIYTISKGKNWGLGSKSPVSGQQAVLCLEKMNRILDFQEDLAYVRVEPGVTFQQVYEFLQGRKSNLMLDVTGAHGDTSIVGNAVERGHGMGLQADRFSHVTDFEVVLANGDVIRTGYSRYGGDFIGSLSKWGVGPEIQGLFAQSNLGIVVSMTLWLQPKPAVALPFFFGCDQLDVMSDAIIKLCRFKLGGTKISYRVFNDFRMLSFVTRVPEGSASPLSDLDRQKMQESIGWQHRWYGLGCIYADSLDEAKALKSTLNNALHDVDSLAFFPEDQPEIIHTNSPTLNFGNEFLSAIRASFLGVPIAGVTMCYWRMPQHIPSGTDPDKDRCGIIWICPKIPATKASLLEFNVIIKQICLDAGFEPNIGLLFPTSRSIDATVAILYDRSVQGSDEAAKNCHAMIFEALCKAQFFPYRLATQAMTWLPETGTKNMLADLKHLLDPEHILAPGRYE